MWYVKIYYEQQSYIFFTNFTGVTFMKNKLKKIKIFVYLLIVALILATLATLLAVHFTKYERRYAKKPVHKLLQKTYDTFRIPKQGIIHIGARGAEELPIYEQQNINDILWIEADPAPEKRLFKKTAKHPGSKVAMFAATDTNGSIDLHITSNGDSSSILKLKNHLFMSPDVVEKKVITVPQKRLDDYLHENTSLKDIQYNVIVIDIQGAELVALKGSVTTLEHIDAIITEANYEELYEGAVNIAELDAFLLEHGFLRVDSISENRSYGDALYVKTKFCTHKTL